jgi:hypothetical protein
MARKKAVNGGWFGSVLIRDHPWSKPLSEFAFHSSSFALDERPDPLRERE